MEVKVTKMDAVVSHPRPRPLDCPSRWSRRFPTAAVLESKPRMRDRRPLFGTSDGNVAEKRSRFLRKTRKPEKSEEAETETEDAPPDYVHRCEDKVEKLKRMFEKRKGVAGETRVEDGPPFEANRKTEEGAKMETDNVESGEPKARIGSFEANGRPETDSSDANTTTESGESRTRIEPLETNGRAETDSSVAKESAKTKIEIEESQTRIGPLEANGKINADSSVAKDGAKTKIESGESQTKIGEESAKTKIEPVDAIPRPGGNGKRTSPPKSRGSRNKKGKYKNRVVAEEKIRVADVVVPETIAPERPDENRTGTDAVDAVGLRGKTCRADETSPGSETDNSTLKNLDKIEKTPRTDDGKSSVGSETDSKRSLIETVSNCEEEMNRLKSSLARNKIKTKSAKLPVVEATKPNDSPSSSDSSPERIEIAKKCSSESSGYETSDEEPANDTVKDDVGELHRSVSGDESDASRVSECDSEDSFIICFENGPDDEGADSCGATEASDDEETLLVDEKTDGEESDKESNAESQNEEVSQIETGPLLKSCVKPKNALRSTVKKKPGERPTEEYRNITMGRSLFGVRHGEVQFVEAKPEVHLIIAWKHAYHMARKGDWQKYSRDEERFKTRIQNTSCSIDWVLNPKHRNKIFFQRFRPILMRWKREEQEAKRKAKQEALEREAREKEEKEIREKEEQELREKEEQELREKELLIGEEPESEPSDIILEILTNVKSDIRTNDDVSVEKTSLINVDETHPNLSNIQICNGLNEIKDSQIISYKSECA